MSGEVLPPWVLLPRRHLRPEGSCSPVSTAAFRCASHHSLLESRLGDVAWIDRSILFPKLAEDLFRAGIALAQVLVNYGSLNSSSIRDTYERDFYLLKNVIKQHDNVIECVVGRDVPCTHTWECTSV